MAYDNVGDQVSLIIDGGESEAGIESTVLRVVADGEGHKIQILRPGFVTKEDLEVLFQGQILVEYTIKNPELSPGMKYKHYSINGEVKLISCLQDILKDQKKTGYLVTQEFYDQHTDFFLSLSEKEKKLIKIRGSHTNLASCAHRLFDLYHRFDQQEIEILYVEALPEVGVGYAIMNRVKRSAELG